MKNFPSIPKLLFWPFVLLVTRKIVIALIAMNTVRIHNSEVSYESMMRSSSLHDVASSLPFSEDTFVLILNQHALNMTLNWLCNTAGMPGVHNHSLIVTLDAESSTELRKIWPDVRQLNWIVPSLSKPFNYGDGYYQLFYLFRSNLARTLLAKNRTFWMIQQDTFWAESLSKVPLNESEYDIIFDRSSSKGQLIAGGYYRARPTEAAKDYFHRLSNDISWWYTPDNAYMTSLCQIGNIAECGGLPFSLITNWQWLDEPDMDTPPKFIQFDGETQLGGKLAKMRNLGFYFLNEDGFTCNSTAFQTAQRVLHQRTQNWDNVPSYSHNQFKMYQNIVDTLFSNSITSWLLNRWILPYAHFCMLTL